MALGTSPEHQIVIFYKCGPSFSTTFYGLCFSYYTLQFIMGLYQISHTYNSNEQWMHCKGLIDTGKKWYKWVHESMIHGFLKKACIIMIVQMLKIFFDLRDLRIGIMIYCCT